MSFEVGSRWRDKAYPRLIIEVASVDEAADVIRFVELTDAAGHEICRKGETLSAYFLGDYEPLPPDGYATELERLGARVEALEQALSNDPVSVAFRQVLQAAVDDILCRRPDDVREAATEGTS